MKVIEGIEQGTAEWHAMRRGKVTGTKLADVMGSSLERVQLIADLIAQEATELTKVIRATPEMERGSAEEPFAVKAYEELTAHKIERVSFCVSDEFDWLGFSPDGLIFDVTKGYVGGIEIKNPNSDTAIFYRLTKIVGMEALGLGTWVGGTKTAPERSFKPSSKQPFLGVPADYKWQVVCAFLVNENLEWMDFLVYDARFIDAAQKLDVTRVERKDPQLQAAMDLARIELTKFRADWLRWREQIMPMNF
ncbi:MAG TPA: YqaJ viral recombinase family protein [Acidobacteriaceae bacterium]|nr:YqaJ viral recombinase family protein [Acidobacteriaceae bacterium]